MTKVRVSYEGGGGGGEEMDGTQIHWKITTPAFN